MQISDLVARYPTFYHMAEKDSWKSIQAWGLLSTSAVLDLHKVAGATRIQLEERHRPTKVTVGSPPSQIVLRDQSPMPPERIARALVDGTTPESWYKFLNGRVFMWAREERLLGLLGARQYRALEHDVLSIDSARLLKDYSAAAWLCRMNSGNTWPMPHARGMYDFLRIEDYPSKSSGAPSKEVVEVVFDYAIPDIAKYVIQVRRMKGSVTLSELPL